MLHRNSQKRYYIPQAIYFITVCTQDKIPYFEEKIFCELFIDDLRFCKNLKHFKLFGFNVLLNHIHLLIQPNNEYNISRIMNSLKGNFSRNANKIINCSLIEESDPTLGRLREHQNNFIQKYGFDKNTSLIFKWQKSFYDHIIRNEKDLQNHYNYTVYNHLKHNLSNNWKYTSLNHSNLIDKI